jgi:serine/threonine-protein phosphatase 6 catalytic subunit
VRAHQLVESGYIYNFGDKSFVTVWSAPNYCYRCGNEASVMKVDEVETSFINFDSSEETSRKKIHYENILPYFL